MKDRKEWIQREKEVKSNWEEWKGRNCNQHILYNKRIFSIKEKKQRWMNYFY